MAKGKYIFHHCGHCDRETKMEVIGSSEGQPDRTWYRCTRCRHASMINLEELRKTQEESKKRVTREDAIEYNPAHTYTVGQSIFHAELGEVGKVVSKEKTSRGESAILVDFETLGERRLMENVSQETIDSPE
jgi:hypothetical protein